MKKETKELTKEFSIYTKIQEEIEYFASKAHLSQNVSLSSILTLLNNKNELIMWHDVSTNELKFMYTDNSKPYHYLEFNDDKVVEKVFDDKNKCISFDFPLYEKIHPATLEATSFNMFCVFEYELQKEWKTKKPNILKIKNIIYETLKTFKIYEKTYITNN